MSLSEHVCGVSPSSEFPRLSRTSRVASVLGAVLLVCSGCLGGPGSQPDGTNQSVTTASTATPSITTTSSTTTTPPTTAAPPTRGSGESLDSTLAGYLDAENRSAYADEHGLRTQNGRVEVVVELEAGTVLPATVEREVVASHEGLVQAYVAPDDLVRVATHANVTEVRAPNRPETDAGTGGSA